MKTTTFSTKNLFFWFSFSLMAFGFQNSHANPITDLFDKIKSDETLIPFEIGLGAAILFLALLFFMQWDKKRERKKQMEKKTPPKKTISKRQ